jgi:hypothetical protein
MLMLARVALTAAVQAQAFNQLNQQLNHRLEVIKAVLIAPNLALLEMVPIAQVLLLILTLAMMTTLLPNR